MLGLGFKTLPRTCTRIFFSVNQQTTCLFGFVKIFFSFSEQKTRILKTKEIFFFFQKKNPLFFLSENIISHNRNNRILKTKKIFFFSFEKKNPFFFFCLCLVKQGLVFLKKKKQRPNKIFSLKRKKKSLLQTVK